MSDRGTFEWHGQSFVHGAITALAWVEWGAWWGVGAFLVLAAANVASALLPPPWNLSIPVWPRPGRGRGPSVMVTRNPTHVRNPARLLS